MISCKKKALHHVKCLKLKILGTRSTIYINLILDLAQTHLPSHYIRLQLRKVKINRSTGNVLPVE